MTRTVLGVAFGLMFSAVLCLVGVLLIGRGVPEAWQVIYARRDADGYWSLHLAETQRGVTRPFRHGTTFLTEPVPSPDRRFVLWEDSGGLRLLDFDAQITRPFAEGYAPVWSPDSRAVAYTRGGRIYVTALDEAGIVGESYPISPPRSDSSRPRWSPDGEWLAFQTYRDNNQQVFIATRTGANLRQIDTNRQEVEMHPSWSPDGSQLVFVAERNGSLDLYISQRDGYAPQRLTRHPANELAPMWSPDGRYLSFTSDQRYILGELYLVTLNDDAPPLAFDEVVLVRNGLRWSPDSSKIVFVSGEDGEIYSIDINGGTVRQLTSENTSHRIP